jgi:cell wall-associated NlpC family hydrolase
MPNDGYRVKKADLQKGDLVFFDTSGSNNGAISHVGMYIGNGQFIHSSSGKKRGVTISSLGEAYYQRTYVTAARVL